MKTIAISIPKPCHEDWNKMTPDAKGAFCASCQKSVYDFSNKTDEEILAVFENKGKEKVCGRFTSSQLTRPVVTFGEPNSTNRLAVFLCALLLVFGANLFSGAGAFAQEVKGDTKVKVMGKMYIQPVKADTTQIQDTIIPEKKIEVRNPRTCGTKIIMDNEVITMGQTMVVQEPIKLMGDTIIQEMPETIDTVAAIDEIPQIDTIAPIQDPEPINYVLGGISYVEKTVEAPVKVDPNSEKTEDKPVVIPEAPEAIQEHVIVEEEPEVDETKSVTETILVPPSELDVKVSPNPSNGEISIAYTLDAQMPVSIELFDVTGKMVRTLSKIGSQYPGKYTVMYTIADLPNGIYMATLTTSKSKSSAKIILTK